MWSPPATTTSRARDSRRARCSPIPSGLIGSASLHTRSVGLSIVEVTNPTQPRNIALVPGPPSLWRETRTYGEYVYVTTEARSGLDIISMRDPDHPLKLRTWNKTVTSAHTLWADAERGLLFVNGANGRAGGMRILDIGRDPEDPDEVGAFSSFYIHDSYTRGDTLYASAIYDGVLSGKLELLNGLFGLLLQHKGLLAWLWANRESQLLTAEERTAIREHLPATRWIEDVPVDEVREGLVAKQVFGREGEEVFLGDQLTDHAWRSLQQRRTYVAHRRVVSPALAAVVPGLGCMEVRQGHLTVGSFAVAGSWAGYYTRLGGPITDETANWLATFEEQP